MKKVYLLLLSLVVLMIALTGCGKDTDSAKDNSKPITLRYSTMQNKDHISYQVALNIKQAVEEKTEGRVLIDIYPANQLGDWSQNSSLTLSSIAERFWVNPSYLSRYFKTYMGINIVQYIRSMRIFYAKSLLQSSDMSIAEVAEMVGIKSASHFSKIFENEVGESPSKFRKSYFDRNHS